MSTEKTNTTMPAVTVKNLGCSFTHKKCNNPVLNEQELKKFLALDPSTLGFVQGQCFRLCKEHLTRLADALAPLEYDYFYGHDQMQDFMKKSSSNQKEK